ncbi:hypothetical protein [Arenibacter sp. F20364]|uniref:hypothetical protein n=1 Tax=Arenibacter sp. F20364 TaxID=2926415 RepID=UPI001FF57147|nr:hypothetical protein [Arenibacter sp. F20364]MCK0188508.1 hypothetical protein [Arenibacter sp. F20364]
MKTIITGIVIFLCAWPLKAQLEQDKAKHFVAGSLSGAIGADIGDRLSGGNRYWRIAGAVTSSLLAGLAKEAYDEHKYGGWDNRDLAATVLGGVSIGITIDIFSEKKQRRRREMMFDLTQHNVTFSDQETDNRMH